MAIWIGNSSDVDLEGRVQASRVCLFILRDSLHCGKEYTRGERRAGAVG